jgi:hypothetical protein
MSVVGSIVAWIASVDDCSRSSLCGPVDSMLVVGFEEPFVWDGSYPFARSSSSNFRRYAADKGNGILSCLNNF